MAAKRVAIFGAGVAGLSAARHLSKLGFEVPVYEKDSVIGGLARTFRNGTYLYDLGPHYFHRDLAEEVGIAAECSEVPFSEALYLNGKELSFPLGLVKETRLLASLVGSYARSLARRTEQAAGAGSVTEFAREHYGARAADMIVLPLIEKWTGLPGERVSAQIAWRLPKLGVRIAGRGLWMSLTGAARHIDPATGSRVLVYPQGGAVRLCEKMAESVSGGIHLQAGLTALHIDHGAVQAAAVRGGTVEADAFVSTIPVTDLAHASRTALDEFMKLRYRALVVLFLRLSRDRISGRLWTWFPDRRFPFYRVAELKNGAEHVAPPGRTIVSVEIACDTSDKVWTDTNEALVQLVLPHLEEVYGLSETEVIAADSFRAPHAYPIYDIEVEEERKGLGYRTPLSNLYLAGRTGKFQYLVMEGSYASGRDCADIVASDLRRERRPDSQ